MADVWHTIVVDMPSDAFICIRRCQNSDPFIAKIRVNKTLNCCKSFF